MVEFESINAGPRYAPFGKRLAAFLIDLIVLGFVMLMAQFTIPYFAPFLVWVGYKTLFECSAAQATPGKRAMDLIVVGAHGERLSFGSSLLRTFIAWLSVFSCFLIYFVVLFTPKRQAIHDLLAGTFVVEGSIPMDPAKAWLEETRSLIQSIRAFFGSTRSSEQEKLNLLEQLNRLKNQGALTDQEYEARKKAILGE